MGDFLGTLLEPLFSWLFDKLPRGCLMAGCLGLVLAVVMVWLFVPGVRR